MGLQMRAMQTAVGAFGGGIWHENDPVLPLMTEVCAEAGVSAAHPAASVTSVPFVACELCREHLGVRAHLLCIALRVVRSGAETAICTRDCCITVDDAVTGVHPCDRRRSLGVYREAFPGIDFSNIKDLDDVLWKVSTSVHTRPHSGLQFTSRCMCRLADCDAVTRVN